MQLCVHLPRTQKQNKQNTVGTCCKYSKVGIILYIHEQHRVQNVCVSVCKMRVLLCCAPNFSEAARRETEAHFRAPDFRANTDNKNAIYVLTHGKNVHKECVSVCVWYILHVSDATPLFSQAKIKWVVYVCNGGWNVCLYAISSWRRTFPCTRQQHQQPRIRQPRYESSRNWHSGNPGASVERLLRQICAQNMWRTRSLHVQMRCT